MKKTLIFLLISILTISLSANSKTNFVDRKKNFDSRAKFLLGMQEVITSEKLTKNIQELKNTVNEVDTTYRSGEKDKIKSVISMGELKVATFQTEYSTFISGETKELMEAYSSQVTTSEEKELEAKLKPTVSHTTMKEKSAAYFRIAKTDYANATKFERDGNLQYAIQLFKRALSYTVLAFDNSKYPLPAKFLSLSKNVTPANDSEVSPIGNHSNPAKDEKSSKDSKSLNPSKSIK